MYEDSNFSTYLPTCYLLLLIIIITQTSEYGVVSHVFLICISLITNDIEYFFHVLIVCFIWRCIYSSPLLLLSGLFFFLLLGCKNSLYVLDV